MTNVCETVLCDLLSASALHESVVQSADLQSTLLLPDLEELLLYLSLVSLVVTCCCYFHLPISHAYAHKQLSQAIVLIVRQYKL